MSKVGAPNPSKREKSTHDSQKSKNQPNFWSFWSYTFIFGEDRVYFKRKLWIENQDFVKIFSQHFDIFEFRDFPKI